MGWEWLRPRGHSDRALQGMWRQLAHRAFCNGRILLANHSKERAKIISPGKAGQMNSPVRRSIRCPMSGIEKTRQLQPPAGDDQSAPLRSYALTTLLTRPQAIPLPPDESGSCRTSVVCRLATIDLCRIPPCAGCSLNRRQSNE